MNAEQNFIYQPISLTQINKDLYIAKLLPVEGAIEFRAGQYIEIQYPDGSFLPFSIACAPNPDHSIELHIRYFEDDGKVKTLIEHLSHEKRLVVRGPFGSCCYPLVTNKPLIILVTGVGFAQAKSFIEQAIVEKSTRSIHLFWGGRTQDDFYCLEWLTQWQKKLADFKYTLVVSRTADLREGWYGQRGYVQEVLLQYYTELSNYVILASGSALMIQSAFQICISHGLSTNCFFSDIPP